MVKQNLCDQYTQTWYERVFNTAKCLNGKRNNNIIYFYEVTTTSMFNFTKTPMKSEQTGQYL
jgi:hypothetical protein